jgi:hypothetical protein
MATTLFTTTALVGDHWEITGGLDYLGTLPREVFIYTNTGDGTLGEFYGTCNLQELGRLKIFTGTSPGPQPIFGNKYLRSAELKIKVALQDDPAVVLAALIKNVKDLSASYARQQTVSATYIIP